MSALWDCLAAYRLTRFVTADTLVQAPRDGLVRWAYRRAGTDDRLVRSEPGAWSELAMADPDAPKLATLVTCRWCAGMWISLGVLVLRRYLPRLWAPTAKALTYSAGAALLARLEDE